MVGMKYLKEQDIANLNLKEMKYTKYIHTTLGIIPFFWFISFLTMIIIGTIKLGSIPKYGNHIDPYALGLDSLNLIEVVLSILGLFSFILWLVLTPILYYFFKNKTSLNKSSIVLCIIGVLGFIVFRFIFTETFLWVVD
ncbi:MAG: hypothetical protein CFE21_10550 [Bacteroidetes bacterium B1(2017)]|nr:MAG: hypothetical protein CFE21_10550 [Bacteroidetes bacterium B1(2017)]